MLVSNLQFGESYLRDFLHPLLKCTPQFQLTDAILYGYLQKRNATQIHSRLGIPNSFNYCYGQ